MPKLERAKEENGIFRYRIRLDDGTARDFEWAPLAGLPVPRPTRAEYIQMHKREMKALILAELNRQAPVIVNVAGEGADL